MKFLVTNDDGWDADGIDHLAAVASKLGSVTVIAPAKPQSGISHQLTLDRSMELVEQNANWFSLDGTPADCVRYGLHHLGLEFDWVFSGINHGANLGVGVFTSGTVAAAREANFHGVSAIAFSQYRTNMGSRSFDWQRSAQWCASTLEFLLRMSEGGKQTTKPSLVNVNLPDLDTDDSTMPEMVSCETDVSPLPIEYTTENGLVRFSGSYQDRPRVPDQDIDVCFGGRIAISRLG